MGSTNKTRLLESEDIFDIYACQLLLGNQLITDDDMAEVKMRIYEIRDIYVDVAKDRIRAEANFVGHKLNVKMTFADILNSVRSILEKNLMDNPFGGNEFGGVGGGFMKDILKAHQISGSNLKDRGVDLERFGMKEIKPEEKKKITVDPSWFKKNQGSRIWDNPKWHEIAKTYCQIESAGTPEEIVQSIDYLNALQHNSFHLLIDLQCGRMLEGKSEGSAEGDYDTSRQNLQTVLDLIHDSKNVTDYKDKLSRDIRKLVNKYMK